MDITIRNKNELPLLHRTEIQARVAYEGATPKRQTLRGAIAEALKAPADHLVVRTITTEFGKQTALVACSLYSDGEALERYEPRHMKKRHGMKLEEKAAAPAGGK